MLRRIVLAFALAALACACGTETDIFGSLDNVPESGVAPYTKVDLNPDVDLTQPFVRVSESSTVEYREPSALIRDGVFHIWVEKAEFLPPDQNNVHTVSRIVHLTSGDGLAWDDANGGAAVLLPDEPWEDAFVGAPTVIHDSGLYRMWYGGGDGRGMGYAESADGDAWTKPYADPVMVPTQPWEESAVFAPCVVFDHGKFRMWYSAGSVAGPRIGVATGNAIGYAWSEDGVAWVKADGAGNSEDAGDEVGPVLAPTRDWEGRAVTSPTVVVDHTVARKILRMWYTGNVPGDIFFDDASVGYAGSLDYVNWVKAEPPVNPVLQEVFPLVFQGITDYLLYDECQPTVVRDGRVWYMYYIQLDALNALSGGGRGLAVATNPPLAESR